MKILLLLGALAVAVAPALAPGDASAALEKLDFSTTYNGGPYSGDTLTGYMLLDVVGGSALSGTLSITGVGLVPTTVTMGLVPVGEVYEAGDGTELFAEDDKIPIDSSGITFGSNAPGSLSGGYTLQFLTGGENGECGAAVVCGMIAGPGGAGNLYNALGPTTITEAAVPEGSTWAMLLIGFAALGFAGYRRRRPTVAFA